MFFLVLATFFLFAQPANSSVRKVEWSSAGVTTCKYFFQTPLSLNERVTLELVPRFSRQSRSNLAEPSSPLSKFRRHMGGHPSWHSGVPTNLLYSSDQVARYLMGKLVAYEHGDFDTVDQILGRVVSVEVNNVDNPRLGALRAYNLYVANGDTFRFETTLVRGDLGLQRLYVYDSDVSSEFSATELSLIQKISDSAVESKIPLSQVKLKRSKVWTERHELIAEIRSKLPDDYEVIPFEASRGRPIGVINGTELFVALRLSILSEADDKAVIAPVVGRLVGSLWVPDLARTSHHAAAYIYTVDGLLRIGGPGLLQFDDWYTTVILFRKNR